MSYANCGLPYYVGGVIKEQKELTLQTPESFWDRFRIDVRVQQEATAINPTEKTVTVHALDSGKVYTETYDKLLLAAAYDHNFHLAPSTMAAISDLGR